MAGNLSRALSAEILSNSRDLLLQSIESFATAVRTTSAENARTRKMKIKQQSIHELTMKRKCMLQNNASISRQRRRLTKKHLRDPLDPSPALMHLQIFAACCFPY